MIQSSTRRRFLTLLATLALSARTTLVRAAEESRIIYIQPLGKALPDADVAMVKEALKAFYRVEVKVLPRVALPKSAYYPK